MPFLSEFQRGERVFIAESPNEWLGVEVIGDADEPGQVKVKVVFTNEIPGYELGDEIEVSDGVLAHRELTVNALIDHRDRS